MQSRINLKIKQDEAKKKEKEKISVNKKLIDQFDANYVDMCDNKKMNIRQRGVSKDNPFEHNNKPPREHLVADYILEKPGKIKDIKTLGDSRPLAGRFSEIGERIFTLGGKKASQLCTGPWGEI